MAGRYKSKAASHNKKASQPGNKNGIRQRHNLGTQKSKPKKHNPY